VKVFVKYFAFFLYAKVNARKLMPAKVNALKVSIVRKIKVMSNFDLSNLFDIEFFNLFTVEQEKTELISD